METVMDIVQILSGFSTVAIAVFAFVSYRLTSQIKKNDDEFKQQVSDLYKALVISNVLAMNPHAGLSNESIAKGFFNKFNEYYDGETPIGKIQKRK